MYVDPETGEKHRLGPVIITGENIDRALAAFSAARARARSPSGR